VTDEGEANARRQTDIAGPDDGYSHEMTSNLSLCPEADAILYDNS